MAKINTVFGFKDEMSQGLSRVNDNLGKIVDSLNSMKGGMNQADESVKKATGGLSNFGAKMLTLNSVIGVANAVKNAFVSMGAGISNAMEGCVAAYNYQFEQETKLETVMRKRMKATDADIQSIKDLASAQQSVGVFGDELILQGAQELATFTSNKEAIATLIPAMNNLIAQNAGMNANGGTFQGVADMMGKVMSGQTGGLSRIGYVFSDEEAQMLKTGTEMERAATLAKIITDNVGKMNETLAKTPMGQIRQLENMMGDLRETTGKLLLPLKQDLTIFKSKVMVDFYASINKALQRILPYVRTLIRAIQDIYIKTKPYIEKVGQFIENVFKKSINFVIEHLDLIVQGMIIVAAGVVAACVAMAVAWAIANWQILAIVGAIALFLKGLKDAGYTTDDICAKIGEIFGVLYGTIKNIFRNCGQLFASLAEFFANVWDDPLGAVLKLYVDFGNTVYNVLNTIAKGIDLLFGSKLSKGVEFLQNEMNKYYETKFHATANVTPFNWEETFDAAAKGKQLGKEVGEKIEKTVKLLQDALKNPSAFDSTTLRNIFESEGLLDDLKTDSTGALIVSDKNMIDIADDWRELLSARALEKFNYTHTNITPNVSFNGGMIFNNNADDDLIIENMVAGIAGCAESSLRAG